jgi:hypothetical protein
MVAMPKMVPYAAGLAAVLALGACSGGDPATAQTVSAPSVTSTSPGPSPTSSAPSASTTRTEAEDPVLAKIPKEARAKTQKGAEAFVRFYFAQLNGAFREADPRAVEGLATEACKICSSMFEGVKEVRSKERHYGSDLITVESAAIMDFRPHSSQVLVHVKQNLVDVLDAKGRVVETISAGSGKYVFTLEYPEGWRVARVQEAK